MYIVGVGGWFQHFCFMEFRTIRSFNSQCLAMAAREHGAVEVDVAVAGGVPGDIFLSCYNIVLQSNLWGILLISTWRAKLPNALWINQWL